MEWISKLIDINKIPIKIVVLIWIISWLLLYLPPDFINGLNLTEFKSDYGKYFGIAFLTSSAFLLIMFVAWIINKISNQIRQGKYKTIIREAIDQLDMHEKSVLREFFIQGKHTLKMPIDDPTVSGLLSKRVLYQVSQLGEMGIVGMLFNCSITDIARKLLSPQILELPITEPSEAEINKIRDARPRWMIKYESNRRWFDF